ncbi:putative winged helix-turn-helix DNA-binding domain-containing protein [Lupinus albus]|uniref:Putative winged helix-turn-helix DNA-binding domain-containing protein n=1 Tax=Lupinus albus TaxID=3870 RepID=A0A6A4NN45_LUPAL|nr:putative winged helix-turn-helix DNA-binding domain-containing protein [Lupinus albus]
MTNLMLFIPIPMAESSVFFFANSLLAKFDSSHIYEASLDIGVYVHFQSIKESLVCIKAWVQKVDLEIKPLYLREFFMREIKNVLYDAENVLDEFEYERLRNEVVNAHVNSITKVALFFSTSNPFVFGLRMTKQIKQLDQRLCSIKLKIDKYGFQMIGIVDVQEDRRKRSLKRSDYSYPHHVMIGREEDKEIIIKLLTYQNPYGYDHQSVSVIPIVGMEGLGKTALAHSVFIDQRIDQSFSSKIWVSVTHGFHIKQVIAQIIQCITGTLVEVEEQHINQLRIILQKQKFLLVLDDVGNEDPLKWSELRNLISSGMEGSKVLVTTRSHSTASMMGTIPSHTLKCLSMEDSFSLFQKCAFREGEEKNFPDLIKVGREIVNKCGGVPLAIKSMGSMLNSNYEINIWKFMRDREFWDLSMINPILPALRLSYLQMPSHLKQCFEMFSLYPDDFVFHSLEVASLWAALGFLPSPNKDETLIDVANQCLLELMSRSFLQEFVNFGTSYYFQIHNLVNDLARYIAKDDCHMASTNFQIVSMNVQHLSFAKNESGGKQ